MNCEKYHENSVTSELILHWTFSKKIFAPIGISYSIYDNILEDGIPRHLERNVYEIFAARPTDQAPLRMT